MKNFEMVNGILRKTEVAFTKMLGKTMTENDVSIFDTSSEAMPYIADLLKYWQGVKSDLLQYAEKADTEKEAAAERHKEEIKELKDELREQRRLLNDILRKVSMPE